MAAIRAQYSFPDELIQGLAARLGVSELRDFTEDGRRELDDEEAKAQATRVKELIFGALDIVLKGDTTVPENAVLLDDSQRFAFFGNYSDEIRDGAKMSPAAAVAKRFHTKPGEAVWLTETQLIDETIRAYRDRGRNAKTARDVVHDALSRHCQSVISEVLQQDYSVSRERRQSDFSHLNKTHAVLQASLDGKTEVVWTNPDTGLVETLPVPPWKRDANGNGYGFTYNVITASYIVEATKRPPILRATNQKKVLEWIAEQNVQGIVLKVKGAKKNHPSES